MHLKIKYIDSRKKVFNIDPSLDFIILSYIYVYIIMIPYGFYKITWRVFLTSPLSQAMSLITN